MKEKMTAGLALFVAGTFVAFCSMIGSMAADGYECLIADIAQKRAEKKAKKAKDTK